eukprot:353841-Chlamydomonas_euryale.AAC.2
MHASSRAYMHACVCMRVHKCGAPCQKSTTPQPLPGWTLDVAARSRSDLACSSDPLRRQWRRLRARHHALPLLCQGGI